MDICGSTAWNISELQGTSLNFQMIIKNLLFPISNASMEDRPQTAEVLRIEGACMIILMVFFVILALMGSLITVYEFFCERKAQKNKLGYEVVSKEPGKIPLAEIKCHTKSNPAIKEDIGSFLKCFCIFQNGKKILVAESSKEQFGCLQGIRLIGCLWVIIFHTSFFYILTLRNLDKLKPWMGSSGTYILFNLILIIDVFFVLGGFLNAYTFCKDYVKNKGKISIPYFYIKRFVRIVPAYGIVLGFHTLLFPYSCSGFGTKDDAISPACKEGWWRNLVFINNFQPTVQQCMSWCWYLATEMQCYIVSPFFMILILRRPAFGYGFTGLCIFLSCFSSFIITERCNLTEGFGRILLPTDNLAATFSRASLYYENVHVMPHTRLHSYLVGILLGIYVHKRRNAVKETKYIWVILCCGWIVSVALTLGPIFGLYNRKESLIEIAVYNGIKDLSFSVGCAWLIFVCVNGQGGFINRILSFKIYFPFSKLSYCAYLIHMVIIMRFYKTSQELQEFSISSMIYLCVYINFWTVVFAFLTSLLVELPMVTLFDYFRNKTISQQSIKKEK